MPSQPKTSEPPCCPQCGAHLVRVRRHAFDRLVSLFRPVRRFRCRKPDCGWEGTLRKVAGD